MKCASALAIMLVAATAAACSGPGAQQDAIINLWISTSAQLAEVVMWAAMYRIYRNVLRGPGNPRVLIVLLGLHIFIWSGYIFGGGGDCGMAMMLFSVVMLFTTIALLMHQRSLRT